MAGRTVLVAACLMMCGALEACAESAASAPPTAVIARAESTVAPQAPPPTLSATALRAPPAPPAPTEAPTPAESPDPLVQYRRWMEEARAQYPYDESLDKMWAVMLCESSGDAAQVSELYYGLFQYMPDTWAGEWNPYRDQPILDPQAQIFATAKAWHEGNQGWWGCY